MGAVKDWAMSAIYELDKDGLSVEEIAETLNCSVDFVKATLGID